MATKRVDEVLDKAATSDIDPIPRYNLIAADGTVLNSNIELQLANTVLQQGMTYDAEVANEMLAASGLTTGAAPTYSLAQDGYSLDDMAPVIVKLHTGHTAAATLNVNATGDKAVVFGDRSPVTFGVSGTLHYLLYSATWDAYIDMGSNVNDPVATFTHSGSGQTHNFIGRDSAQIFMVRLIRPIVGGTFQINGTAITLYNSAGVPMTTNDVIASGVMLLLKKLSTTQNTWQITGPLGTGNAAGGIAQGIYTPWTNQTIYTFTTPIGATAFIATVTQTIQGPSPRIYVNGIFYDLLNGDPNQSDIRGALPPGSYIFVKTNDGTSFVTYGVVDTFPVIKDVIGGLWSFGVQDMYKIGSEVQLDCYIQSNPFSASVNTVLLTLPTECRAVQGGFMNLTGVTPTGDLVNIIGLLYNNTLSTTNSLDVAATFSFSLRYRTV